MLVVRERRPGAARARPRDDGPGEVRIGDLTRVALAAGAAGAAALGLAGELVTRGVLPVPGVGSPASAELGPTVFVAGGVGLAVCGLAGATVALLRLPPVPRGATAVRGRVRLLQDGLVAGLLAAVTYGLLGCLVAWATRGDPLEPSRYLASLLLGRDALTTLSPEAAIGWGGLGQLAVSLPSGFGMGALAWAWPGLFADGARAIAVGAALGALGWVAGLSLGGSVLGLPWLMDHDAPKLFLLHAPLFGVAAAGWLHHRVTAE